MMFWNRNLLFNGKPPTLYSLMDSMVNYDSEDKTKIKNLALACHERIFDFEYPLSSKVNKDDFEVLILNRFLMRRIGYETFTAFQIALSVKLNEIMPTYNKMFDMLDGWDLFNDGEITTRTVEENGTGTTENTESRNATDTTDSTSDIRYAELPQNKLSDLQNGTYVTDYTLQANNINNTNNSTSSSNSNTEQENNINESITRTPADKLKIYNEFIQNKNNIYTMIFNDLSCLFYGLI